MSGLAEGGPPAEATLYEEKESMSSTGDNSRSDSRDLTTAYLDKSRKGAKKIEVAKAHFARAINGTEALIRNGSSAYAYTNEDLDSLLAGYRAAIDEMEVLWRRAQEPGRGRGWRW